MRVVRSTELDSNWEDHDARYRVYFFEGGDQPGRSWSVDTFDVTDAEVVEVISWAETEAGDSRLFAVELVGERDEDVPVVRRRGLTWLLGMDANDAARNELEQRLQQRMRDRRARHTVRPTIRDKDRD